MANEFIKFYKFDDNNIPVNLKKLEKSPVIPHEQFSEFMKKYELLNYKYIEKFKKIPVPDILFENNVASKSFFLEFLCEIQT